MRIVSSEVSVIGNYRRSLKRKSVEDNVGAATGLIVRRKLKAEDNLLDEMRIVKKNIEGDDVAPFLPPTPPLGPNGGTEDLNDLRMADSYTNINSSPGYSNPNYKQYSSVFDHYCQPLQQMPNIYSSR